MNARRLVDVFLTTPVLPAVAATMAWRVAVAFVRNGPADGHSIGYLDERGRSFSRFQRPDGTWDGIWDVWLVWRGRMGLVGRSPRREQAGRWGVLSPADWGPARASVNWRQELEDRYEAQAGWQTDLVLLWERYRL